MQNTFAQEGWGSLGLIWIGTDVFENTRDGWEGRLYLGLKIKSEQVKRRGGLASGWGWIVGTGGGHLTASQP